MIDQNAPSVATITAQQLRDALHDAFALGWQIVELQSRVQVTVPDSSADRGLQLPGIWQSYFSRIANITTNAFPNASTTNTLHAPPTPMDLPYLYPAAVSHTDKTVPDGATAVVTAGATPFDYADVGIAIQLREDADQKKRPILRDFQLYEVTRRAINCLTLFSASEEDSLIPETLKACQSDLLTQLRPFLSPSQQTESQRGRAFLATQAVRYLEAWHDFLRQNYYIGGKIPDNNLELVAYEAGHAMSALSWELMINTLDLETSGGAENASRGIEDAWNATFTDQSIIHLQHAISALSAALDDAYCQEHPEQKATDDSAPLSVPNPDLPSQSIQAVKSSLDYWVAAVKWVSQNESSFRSGDQRVWRKSLRLALTEQTNVWQTLLNGRESLRAYNVETAAHKIMEDITQEIGDGLRQGFRAAIRQSEEMLQETKKEAKAAIGDVFVSGRSACWILLAMGILVAVVGAVALIPSVTSETGKSVGLTGILSGIGSLLFGGYKWLGLNSLKEDASRKIESVSPATRGETSSILGRLEGAVQNAESAALAAFQRGYEQMRIELDSLNRSIAVTYPLVEFFGKELKLDSNIDFLADVFWSGTKREEEIKRVIRAAFGGLALMFDPKSTPRT